MKPVWHHVPGEKIQSMTASGREMLWFGLNEKQRSQIRSQFPSYSEAQFTDDTWWVCDGFCMLCGEQLDSTGKCKTREPH